MEVLPSGKSLEVHLCQQMCVEGQSRIRPRVVPHRNMQRTRRPLDKTGNLVRLSLCLLLIALLTCLACAPTRKAYHIKPSKVRWEGIHNVAVRGFYGHYGEIVRSYLYRRLAEVDYFNPTDANQIRAVDRLSCDTVEEIEFLQALEDLQADAVITGQVTADIHDIHGSDQLQIEEGTGYYKKAKNVYGQWVDVEIKRTVVRAIPYVVRKVSLVAEYKVFDLHAKGVIAFGELTEAYEEKFGGDKEYGDVGHKLSDLPSSSLTEDELSSKVATKILAKLSRMRLSRFVKLDNSGNSMVKRGVALAKRGDWEGAMHLWQQVIRDEPDTASAYYNLGVAHEALGDTKGFKTAMDLYKTAAIHGENNLYTDGIKRVDAAIRKYEPLDSRWPS